MWLQLLEFKRIKDKHGRDILHYKGEMVYIKNKQIAQKWIDTEAAVDVRFISEDVPKDTGILLLNEGRIPKWAKALELPVTVGDPSVPYAYTIIWNPGVQPQGALMATALRVVAKHGWDLAVPIYSYHKLARDCGRPEARLRTKSVIHDLRVPCYNPGLMFIKRNDRTTALIERWQEEKKVEYPDDRLSFLRALWHVKPFILPLPVLWIKARA